MINLKENKKFEVIKKRVKRDIASGHYKLQERLPSERELAVSYGVNRLTVNRALTELVQEKWLTRVDGIGTFVSNMFCNKAQKQELCRIHLVTVSLQRSSDIAFAHHALNFFRRQGNVTCIIHETGLDGENEYTLLSELLTEPECYILLVGIINPHTRKLIRDHASRFVVLGNAPELDGKVIEVHTDFEAGGRMMMEHLVASGHRRIAYCGDPATDTAPERFHAWKSVLAEHQLMAPDDYIIDIGQYDFYQNTQKQQFVTETLTYLLTLPQRPTAIFCNNDDFASIMIHQCWQRGLRIPDDLSLSGFDGGMTAALDSLALSTVRQPYEEIFQTSLSLLQEQLPKHFPHVRLIPQLIVGKTVGKNSSI